MAFGDLSSGQRAYRDRVARRTGLDRDVVTAWIAAESGWATTKDTHNYLNIGPGRLYPSVASAADAVATLLNSSSHYAGIRGATSRDGLTQIRAIASSPWDAGRYGGDGSRLEAVYRQLTGTNDEDGWRDRAARAIAGAAAETYSTVHRANQALNPATWGGRLVDVASEQLLRVGLVIVFSLAGLVLIVLGVLKLAGASAGAALTTVTGG